MEKRIGKGVITAECRSDGSSVASELYANYPCRLHLTSRPNNELIGHDCSEHKGLEKEEEEEGKIQKITNQSKALTCYVLGYGGGLISGDNICLDITVKPKASLVVTSQSTSKAFKAMKGRDATFVKTQATVGKGGLLFLVPQPMQCFGGSKLEQETQIVLDGGNERGGEGRMDDDPSLILVDWYTGGRKNMDGGLWNMHSFHTSTIVSYSKESLFPCEDNEENSNDDIDNTKISTSDDHHLVFKDATRLSGGKELVHHMKRFNIVCMVVLLGPRVKDISDLFLSKFSSRHTYDEAQHESSKESRSSSSSLNQNRGEGLNGDHEGLLVSCGTFNTLPGSKQCENGVVVRLAADTLETAATFLSKHIGTVHGQLEDDPFLEILSSRQGIIGQQVNNKKIDYENQDTTIQVNDTIPLGLMENSYYLNSDDLSTTTSSSVGSKSRSDNNTTTTKINPLILYQLVDSCVPSGGFAHSNTLEAAQQLHLLHCNNNNSWKVSLRQHCFDVLLQTFTTTVPFLIQSCALFRNHYYFNDDQSSTTDNSILEPPPKELLQRWEKLDIELRAMMNSHVACRASTTQGSGMLRAFSSSFQNIAPVIKRLRKHILKMSPQSSSSLSQQIDCCGHAATCFGAVCGLFNIDDETCISMFLYTTARDMVNAAVRMNLIGPLEGGCVTNELCHGVNTLIERFLPNFLDLEKGNDDSDSDSERSCIDLAHQVAPLIEVLSNAHDRLYTRLFNS